MKSGQNVPDLTKNNISAVSLEKIDFKTFDFSLAMNQYPSVYLLVPPTQMIKIFKIYIISKKAKGVPDFNSYFTDSRTLEHPLDRVSFIII